MTNAIFSTSEQSAYDDQIESRYHFPQTYLKAAESALGELIIYYEPRRNAGKSSSGGRKSYFAVARLAEILPDPVLADHFYGRMIEYLEFDRPVPFKNAAGYFESQLERAGGGTSKGAFGRSIRPVPAGEFDQILRTGFASELDPWELADKRVAEQPLEYEVHPMITQLTTRRFRDRAFVRHVRGAYANTCAMSGLALVNGGGRPEVQAAHIRPVEADGPDTVRNGLALTGTLHWLFDRGLVSLDDSHRILVSPYAPIDQIERLISKDRKLRLPDRPEWRPHRIYLKWHRENAFKS